MLVSLSDALPNSEPAAHAGLVPNATPDSFAIAAAETESVAVLDVALPALFVEMHRKRALLSEDAQAAVAKDAAVAPVAEAQVVPLSLLLCH